MKKIIINEKGFYFLLKLKLRLVGDNALLDIKLQYIYQKKKKIRRRMGTQWSTIICQWL